MKNFSGITGLIIDEGLLWEKGKKGRCGFSLPKSDVESFPLDKKLTGNGPDFPDLSEIDVVRHFTRLSQWNFGIDTGMYPLGSCTMKYNPKTNEKQAALPGFTDTHPLVPDKLSQGALKLMHELEEFLAEITGMDNVTLQPSAGAQGEFAGMQLIFAYHKSKDMQRQRSKIIIPDTAHGTNPSSAALCGYQPISVKAGPDGILSPKIINEVMDENTAGIMLTNPNTLGLFENNILEITKIVHSKGGQVYCDGANMNAIMGIVNMAKCGVDVLHLNLHKTFSSPHGGGGPGSGPVCVKKHLASFLPIPRIIKKNDNFTLSNDFPDSIGKFHTFYGNFSVMVKAYCYIRSMGPKNLRKASELAVLNANYIKEKLKNLFYLPFDKPCMHECVFSDKFQKKNDISTLDLVKRLMDHGIHPPTIFFPLVIKGAIMIEPTETESKEDIDHFIDSLKSIAQEAKDNPELLKNAPFNCKVKRLDEITAARKPKLRE